ncbi:MAG: hypothetical protein ACYDCP_08280 [Thermoplasmataceae archaeon]
MKCADLAIDLLQAHWKERNCNYAMHYSYMANTTGKAACRSAFRIYGAEHLFPVQ